MRLYVVHDEDYSYKIVVSAMDYKEAIEKTHKWLEETKQNSNLWNSKNIKWIAELCDNDIVVE